MTLLFSLFSEPNVLYPTLKSAKVAFVDCYKVYNIMNLALY
jgi:hypothetical protein